MAKTIAGILLSLVGVVILAGGGWYAYEAFQFVGSTESTTGTIVEHKFTGGLNRTTREGGSRVTETVPMYAPIVEYQTGAGQNVQFQANWSEGDPPAIGTIVNVRYSPDAPTAARISSFFSLYGAALILFLIGGVFAMAGVLVLKFSR